MASINKNGKKSDTALSRKTARLDSETKSNIAKVVKIEEKQKRHRTFGERLSDAIAVFCGSMVFVYVHVTWFAAWILYNSWLGGAAAFDPFPYTFLTMVVSLEAIFLSTFILISQNHDTKLAERRNHLDLQINMLTEQENTRMLELLVAIAEKVGVSTDDRSMAAFTEDIDPEKLVKQIMDASGDSPDDIKTAPKRDASRPK
jgi:uncharacterized membrane protein